MMTPDAKDNLYETYVIPGDERISIVLEIPADASNQDLSELPWKCSSNISRLKVSQDGLGTSVNLNPNCSEIYSPEEVSFTLYWVNLDSYPLVEITTNGSACVPTELYAFNTEFFSYELVAEKCGG